VQPLLPFDRGSVFIDGTLSPLRLKHPEGLAVADDGAIWCGGDGGEIYRIEPDGSAFEQIATTGGFTLGMAFDNSGNLFTCDLAHAAVYRLEIESATLVQISTGTNDRPMRIPNFPVFDPERNCLFVSDSHNPTLPGPGIWRIDLASGETTLWFEGDLTFGNGMCFDLDRQSLFVAETFARQITRIGINPDGSAGQRSVFVDSIDRLPDGLALDGNGNLYIACYEPSRIFRATPDGTLELLYDDPDAHMLCHPTNCAFRGTDLFTSNLGRWHITKLEVGEMGAPLR
jgi:gluconolactonase